MTGGWVTGPVPLTRTILNPTGNGSDRVGSQGLSFQASVFKLPGLHSGYLYQLVIGTQWIQTSQAEMLASALTRGVHNIRIFGNGSITVDAAWLKPLKIGRPTSGETKDKNVIKERCMFFSSPARSITYQVRASNPKICRTVRDLHSPGVWLLYQYFVGPILAISGVSHHAGGYNSHESWS